MKTAAEATGLSEATIRRAIHAGDLAAAKPRVAGKPIRKDAIMAALLRRWLSDVVR
ncbi:hypothetical protein [Demequina capsici]|uniref:hypothetical protein n=1 Tax=Demequina capsici TaxID=3075620 RepID=UPI0034D95FAB